MPNDELLSTAAVAAREGVSVYTVNRWVREGLLVPTLQAPGPKGARFFHPDEVDRFAAARSVGAAS
jgi:DNA-binding transcriptional MerR regulator